jgi:hypothetical protein
MVSRLPEEFLTMKTEFAARSLAHGLTAIEPPKIRGGSDARRDWLNLALEIQAYLIRNHLPADTFIHALLEEEYEFREYPEQ